MGTDPALAAPEKQQRSAADDAFGLTMSLETHLAYVRTGRPDIDRISRLGLAALSQKIAGRTAFEPVDPVGVNISKDELAFFPLLYWPVTSNPADLDSETVSRINAYMKQGGVILFDTQDQISNFLPGQTTRGQTPLAKLLARMDIPPLEPVPGNHVLTRSFYLLDDFPGRWSGGTMWVEASGKNTSSMRRAAPMVSAPSSSPRIIWPQHGPPMTAAAPCLPSRREASVSAKCPIAPALILSCTPSPATIKPIRFTCPP